MIHVHPFPARMAPEIALEKIQSLSKKAIVLDPMVGSGMVLSQSVRAGHIAIGGDLDPLARLISKVGSTPVSSDLALNQVDKLINLCRKRLNRPVKLPWIDDDVETADFISYWFAKKQISELRTLSHFLVAKPFCSNEKMLNLLQVAVSRLIVTKEPKASLARDTAHSRPHRTITKNQFSVLDNLEASVTHILKALDGGAISGGAKVYRMDARKMNWVKNNSVDAVITSPPYLNAIDYMRGHKLSLVWLGYGVPELRNIRARSIGAERAIDREEATNFRRLMTKIELNELDDKQRRLLARYYVDLIDQLSETYRVLKPKKTALYVIGNSTVREHYVRNNEILKHCARQAGFRVRSEKHREIPDERRYLPMPKKHGTTLATRMRAEHVIELVK
ncbi:MAG: hypothetical protein RH982_06520 [Parvibaculum sp.]